MICQFVPLPLSRNIYDFQFWFKVNSNSSVFRNRTNEKKSFIFFIDLYIDSIYLLNILEL